MNLNLKIFLTYFLVIGAAIYYLLAIAVNEIKPAMRQSSEETLIDISNLLAEIVADEFQSTELQQSGFANNIDKFLKRKINADIYSIPKNNGDFRIYITDKNGIVRYHSDQKKWGHLFGKDYSQWNDVYLTLNGEYGARSTPDNPKNELSSVMYVAAPIIKNDEIIGVLTVGKHGADVQPFIDAAISRIQNNGFLIIIVSIIFGAALAYWLTSSIRKLTHYANAVSEGKLAELPNIKETELAQLAKSMEKMRIELEGKHYVEQYVHALTHEFKSPIASISGAIEILNKDMSPDDFNKFKGNIARESQRMNRLVNRLLDLVKLENTLKLEKIEIVDLKKLILELSQTKSGLILDKNIAFKYLLSEEDTRGDAFLLEQCFENILQNAIDFSPSGGLITLELKHANQQVLLQIYDEGPGIPDYALDKIFERFYSLPRPNSPLKSSGIGLSFVKQILQLHQASIDISSNTPTGTIVTCSFPRIP